MTAIRRLAAILAADVAKVRSQSICLPSRANRERHLATQLTHRLYLGEARVRGIMGRRCRSRRAAAEDQRKLTHDA